MSRLKGAAFHEAMAVIERATTPQSRALSGMTWHEAGLALSCGWAGADVTFGRQSPPVRRLLAAGVELTPELAAALVVVARAGSAAEERSRRACDALLGLVSPDWPDGHPLASLVEGHEREAEAARTAARLLRSARKPSKARKARAS